MELIGILKQLKRHMRVRPVILLWDRLPSHCSETMKQYLRRKREWLSVVALPAYAPEVNSVEGLWNNIQAHELANQSSDHLSDVMITVEKRHRAGWFESDIAILVSQTCWSIARVRR